jgi:two-component system sensor histidine kinase RstB
VHSIAQALSGNVTIESSPLGGASVRFCWPVDLTLREIPLR